MIGLLTGASSPSRTCRSVRQTPQAWILTRTWFPVGSGLGTSAIRSGLDSTGAGVGRMQAFTVLLSRGCIDVGSGWKPAGRLLIGRIGLFGRILLVTRGTICQSSAGYQPDPTTPALLS